MTRPLGFGHTSSYTKNKEWNVGIKMCANNAYTKNSSLYYWRIENEEDMRSEMITLENSKPRPFQKQLVINSK
jgi:hypothetical protein